jgi:hypothetical protein
MCCSGRPVKGSRPFVDGGVADGGGLTNATPSTDGVTEGRAVVVGELVGEGLVT